MGHFLSESDSSCAACPQDSFKHSAGNEVCDLCISYHSNSFTDGESGAVNGSQCGLLFC